ncbi:hypothetical protein CG716_22670 [Mycolicibacterium sphagni]|uniref:Uncharacterized protein n=1 Tax=Mycolicibacterium sphagni TaxID=1786 RepID=A0A255D9S8_9MYCO|nr:hypothetical protein CG716_22670 [Mycolicibacterium sphagni]
MSELIKPMDVTAAKQLAAAEPELLRLQTAAEGQLQAALAVIAASMSKGLKDHAKTASYQQLPTTTRLVEANKYQAFRQDWEAAINELRDQLINVGAREIRWRSERPISKAVSNYLAGRLAQFDDILKIHGYYVGPNDGINPDELFQSESLDDVERELNALFRAEYDAQKAEGLARVNPLWD